MRFEGNPGDSRRSNFTLKINKETKSHPFRFERNPQRKTRLEHNSVLSESQCHQSASLTFIATATQTAAVDDFFLLAFPADAELSGTGWANLFPLAPEESFLSALPAFPPVESVPKTMAAKKFSGLFVPVDFPASSADAAYACHTGDPPCRRKNFL